MRKYILTTGPAMANETPLSQVHSKKNISRMNDADGAANIKSGIPRDILFPFEKAGQYKLDFEGLSFVRPVENSRGVKSLIGEERIEL